MMKLPVTEKLVDFLVSVDGSDIPDAAIGEAKKAVVDCIGVMLAGAHEPVSRLVIEQINQAQEKPVAQVLGTRHRVSPLSAALANGVLAHALEFDDCCLPLDGHPSAPLLPALLALGEVEGISGRELLEAYVLGYEVENKIARGANPGHAARGWHTTATMGVFGATAGAGRLLGLCKEEMLNAFGIALSFVSGTKASFGTTTKPLHCGMAARNGLTAAFLARKGLAGTSNALEGVNGFFDLYCDADCSDPQAVLRGLGDPFEIIDPGLILKPYPCCGETHAAIAALKGLQAGHQFLPQDIDKIEVGLSSASYACLDYPDPKNPIEARFSMPFCLATILLSGNGTLELSHLNDDWMASADIKGMMRRISMYVHPELDDEKKIQENFSLVSVHLKNGEQLESRGIKAQRKGSLKNPMTWTEISEKYKSCATCAIEEYSAQESLSMLEGLEHLGNIRDLIAVLSP
jgi:2-methylcitrate dehydratase PrpD